MTAAAKSSKCKGKKTNGQACGMPPGPSGYCFAHDPTRAAERAQARRAGGHARHVPHSDGGPPPSTVRTLDDVLQLLDHALAELLMHDNSIARSRELRGLANDYAAVIRPSELEARIAAIEAATRAAA